VGFPGETEADFADTLRVVEASRFAGAFTFQYSIRAGTPAATMPDQIPKPVVQERYERLVEVVEQHAWQENLRQVGRRVEVMFADGEGRKDSATARMSGRARDNRLVHVQVPDDPALRPRPGDIGTVEITYAAPHHLTADSGLAELRRTPGGDAWERRSTQTPRSSVGLGMPAFGPPPALPPVQGCAVA
jgi:tRNA-2-methylthio-N6-dimethylallyladenosine synthase